MRLLPARTASLACPKPWLATSHLGVVISHAGPRRPKAGFQEAMDTCRHRDIIGKSVNRDPRPTLQEPNRLIEYFVEISGNDPRAGPMHRLGLAAIFLTYRRGEHAPIKWSEVKADLADYEMTPLLPNMKPPKKKQGNDVEVQVREEDLSVIYAMPRILDRMFPYHFETITRRSSEASTLLGMEDLHFHDPRHQGIPRLSG